MSEHAPLPLPPTVSPRPPQLRKATHQRPANCHPAARRYHEEPNKEATFALSVQCFPHYGSVSSTWVYVGVLTPHEQQKKKRVDEDEDSD